MSSKANKNSTDYGHKCVIYARVSSREQMEGFSIPAQKKLLVEYAARKNLQVLHVFEEAETAKVSGRKEFNAMLQFLKKNSTVRNVLVEKTDRLYRNLTDYLRLNPETSGIRIHLVKESEILDRQTRSHTKFAHGIKVLVAKNYTDNLSEEVRKGQMEKASQGIWPSSAPIGYKNDREKRTIVPDPQAAPLITFAFESAATGLFSLSKLKHLLYERGLRSRRAKKELCKETMSRILRNPIYTGKKFVWAQHEFSGTHTPLVSVDLFNKVQVAMGFVQKPRITKHDFTYVGLVTCAHCGCAVTADKQKKKSGRSYIYYHCTNGKGICTNVTYIREERFEDAIANALKEVYIPTDIVEWTRDALLTSAKEETSFREKEVAGLTTRYRQIDSYLSQAYTDKLEGSITAEFWEQKSNQWKTEQSDIEARLEALRNANTAYLQEGVRLMELAARAAELFKQLETKEKREMIKLILSNPRLFEGNLVFSLEKPFSMFTNVVNLNEWRS